MANTEEVGGCDPVGFDLRTLRKVGLYRSILASLGVSRIALGVD